MKRLLIIAILFASCTADYDDVEPATYDVRITQETTIGYYVVQTGRKLKEDKTFKVLFDQDNVSQSTKDDAVRTFPERDETMHQPFDDKNWGSMMRETRVVVKHEITRK